MLPKVTKCEKVPDHTIDDVVDITPPARKGLKTIVKQIRGENASEYHTDMMFAKAREG